MLRNFKQFNNLIKIMTFTSYKPHFNISFLNKSANTTFSLNYHPKYRFASQTIPLPHLADSITEGKVIQIKKKVGDWVQLDELVSLIQTDKITIEIKAPKAGLLTKLHVQSGDILVVGKPFFDIDPAGAKPVDTKSPEPEKKTQTPKTSTAQSKSTQSLKSEAPKKQQPKKEVKKQSQPKVQTPNIFSNVTGSTFERKQTREPLSRLRLKVGQRLKQSQNTYALLTTFQEADMSGVMDIRKSLGQQFAQKYGIKLGFMSFFLKAAVAAINDIPIVNAVIDGTDVVHRNYIDISVAVATPTGLMVPIIRNCQNLKMHEIQIQLAQLAKKGKQGKITLQDINGGTFTISNGGTFGSLMGTPIINPPQSAILGMHAIINRPVVKNDQIVARPMMYLALTYDHRLLDGKDAVTFLKKIQNEIQDPRRLLLQI